MFDLLATLGASLTLGLGLLGLFAPKVAGSAVRLSDRSHPEPAELRATYGGLFVGLGAVPLLTGAEAAYLAIGAAWVGAATARIVSLALDRTLSPRNWLAVGFEGGIGGLCLCALI